MISSDALQKMILELVQAILLGVISSALSLVGASGTPRSSTPWYLNSAAFNHMSNQPHIFSEIKPCSVNKFVTTANGKQLPIQGVGTAYLPNPLQ